jgi:hypothetical protein
MEVKFGFLAVSIAGSIMASTQLGIAQTKGQYEDAEAAAMEILNHSLGIVENPSSEVIYLSPDNPVARFISLMQGSSRSPRPTKQEVCGAWKQMPSDQPFTGNFLASGFELSLDKMCEIKR